MEKKKPNIKLIVIIAVVAVLIVGVATAIGIVAYGNFQTRQKIEAMVSEVADDYALFESTEDREEKLSLLTKMNSEYENYISDKNSEEYFEEVKAEYEKNISLMREYFVSEYDSAIDKNTIADLDEAEREDIKASITVLTALNKQIVEEAAVTLNDDDKLNSYNNEISGLIKTMREYFASQYDKVIEENTLKNVEKIEDKEKLSNAIGNLNDLKTLINAEAEVTVANSQALEDYNTKIDSLVKSYENRISAIEKAEEEAKKQQENEARKEGEAQQNYYTNDSSDFDSGSDNDTIDNSSDITGTSVEHDCWGADHGGLQHTYTDTETGFTSYFYNDGYCYDDSGAEGNWKDLQ